MQEEYEANIRPLEEENDDEELWYAPFKQTMYSDEFLMDEMYNPIDPVGNRVDLQESLKRKAWMGEAEGNKSM